MLCPTLPRLLSLPTPVAQATVVLLLGSLAGGLGCNQNGRFNLLPNPNPPAPAAANPAATATAAAEPSGGANDLAGQLAERPRRWSFLSEMQRRAEEQQRLADEQKERLAQLRALQQQTDEQLLALRRQQEQQEQHEREERSQRERQLAQKAQEALGQYAELERRVRMLDANNRDLHAQLARIQQQNQLAEDQNNLLRQRLQETAQLLAQAQQAEQQTRDKLQAVQASLRRRGGATITANNSFRQALTAVTIEGLEVRQDGELVRIELPSDQLFQAGTATLQAGAEALMDRVAEVIGRHYPQQIVGIEAHADNRPVTGTLWRSPHQLTAAQAMAVFEQMTYRNRLPAEQLFVLGHGGNHPLVSNATPAGQARNRRVEVVIYPETYGRR